jgi:hypothetical protein
VPNPSPTVKIRLHATLFILIAHLLVTLAKLARPGGLGAVAAESLAVKHQMLYTTHRALLAEIEAAASGPTPAADLAATVATLEAKNTELRRVIHQLKIDKRNLATESLSLLHRARLAEDRLRARDRELASLKRMAGDRVFGFARRARRAAIVLFTYSLPDLFSAPVRHRIRSNR